MVYKGQSTNFIIYATSEEAVEEYMEDPMSGSLVATLDLYKIYTTSTPGNDRFYHEASNMALHNEFRSHNLDEIFKEILAHGQILSLDSKDEALEINVSRMDFALASH